jgi:hypothetical protein
MVKHSPQFNLIVKYKIMIKEIIHKRSCDIVDGKPKLPTSEQLQHGELALNYAANGETIIMKNSDDNIVEFKSESYYADRFNDINSKMFIGTQEEYDIAYADGKISVGALVIIIDESEQQNDVISLLGTAILGKMILGKQ